MKSEHKSGKGIEMALLGVTAAGIAAAAYFFLGPKGKQHQRHVRSWAIKMKGDVIEKLENAKEVTEGVYNEIVDSVAKEYELGQKAGASEIAELASDLKKHWKNIKASTKNAEKNGKKALKKISSAARK